MTLNNTLQPIYAPLIQNNATSQSQSSASSQGAVDYTTLMQQIDNQLMSSLDSNKNGSIDKSELMAALKKTQMLHIRRYHGSHAMSAHLQDSIANPTTNAQSVNTPPKANNLQSILLEKILSAYGVTNNIGNSDNLSLGV